MSRLIYTVFSISHILIILPLITPVLYVRYQRWRQQRCSSTAPTATSHSDVFTYHMVAMELIAILGCVLYCVGVNTGLPEVFAAGFYVFSCTWWGKTVFHTLTCVERYLAVVHPVTFLRLKNKGGVTVRNIGIGWAWLVCLVWGILASQMYYRVRLILFFIHLTSILFPVSFCCICVLHALRQTSPGEVGGGRERVDRMKQRAFNTVVTIMAVLWLCLGGMLVCAALVESRQLNDNDTCVARASSNLLSLPSSFVLPLLYLQRAGKLPGCKR